MIVVPPSYEQTIEAVSACGVPAANIRIQYEDWLQSDVVIISELDGASEEKFRCLRGAIHPSYILQIEASDEWSAFSSFSYCEEQREAHTQANEWLRARGMLNRVPQYDPAQGIEHFARALEAACSLPLESALETIGTSALTFRRDFLEKGLAAGVYDEFECLRHMLAASNAYEHEIALGFIGNEAVGDDQ